MKTKTYLTKSLQAAKVHFTIPNKTKQVLVPDKFDATNYPKRTQTALKRLQKLGYHLQTEIK